MGAITFEGVANYLGMRPLPEPGTPDFIHLSQVVLAVNAAAPRMCPRVRTIEAGDPWPDDVQQAFVMLGGRLWERRNSVAGVNAFTEMGPSYVARYDPDIDRLLGTGPWSKPAAL